MSKRRPFAETCSPMNARAITRAQRDLIRAVGIHALSTWIIVRNPGLQVWEPNGDGGLDRVRMSREEYATLRFVEKEWN